MLRHNRASVFGSQIGTGTGTIPVVLNTLLIGPHATVLDRLVESLIVWSTGTGAAEEPGIGREPVSKGRYKVHEFTDTAVPSHMRRLHRYYLTPFQLST